MSSQSFLFSNHKLIAGFNTTIEQWHLNARIPEATVLLKSTWTLKTARYEGTLFGRSLAYLLAETVRGYNIYLAKIGVDPDESEAHYKQQILIKCDNVVSWRTDYRFYTLGWGDSIYSAFFGAVKVSFLMTLDRVPDNTPLPPRA